MKSMTEIYRRKRGENESAGRKGRRKKCSLLLSLLERVILLHDSDLYTRPWLPIDRSMLLHTTGLWLLCLSNCSRGKNGSWETSCAARRNQCDFPPTYPGALHCFVANAAAVKKQQTNETQKTNKTVELFDTYVAEETVLSQKQRLLLLLKLSLKRKETHLSVHRGNKSCISCLLCRDFASFSSQKNIESVMNDLRKRTFEPKNTSLRSCHIVRI